MKFRVTVQKEGVANETRVVDLPSRFAVYDEVQKEGGVVLGIDEVKREWRLPSWLHSTVFKTVKHAEVAQTAKNISTMLTAGLSLPRALSVLERETQNAQLKIIAADLAETVGKGSPLHLALGKYPRVFPEILVAMVRVGEESGSLADALNIVGLQLEHTEELTRKVKGALIYPCIIVVAIMVVSILMLIYVVPTLTKTFTELKVSLPESTKLFIALSDFVAGNILVTIGSLLLLFLGGIAVLRSRPGISFTIRASLHLPFVGDIVRETYAARTARTLSSLLAAGVPVLDALSITKEVVHTPVFTAVIEDALAQVKKGGSLSASFVEHANVYPVLMSEILAVGEETGKVAPMLKQIAEHYENDVSEKTKDLSTIIEPFLMLLIGGVVGVFAVSMIAPIYSLSSAI